jgi:3-hydroxyacyl-CoA dehydrogenase
MSPVSTEVRDSRLIIAVDNAPVNALSHAVRDGIVSALALAREDEIDSVVLVCAGRTFFAGADISEFGKPPKTPSLAETIKAIESCGKPVIAAIHGQALGGGLEIALACDYRVMDFNAKLGLPEINLGLIPGAGGTQRLPRLAGLDVAMELAVTGKPVTAERALKSGIIDDISHHGLLDSAIGLSHHGDRQKRIVADLPSPVANSEVSDKWRRHAARKLKGQSAPIAAINAVEASATLSFDDGLKCERELFLGLASGPQSKAMRHLFFSERRAGKLGYSSVKPLVSLNTIGVIGAGTMGVGIATAMLKAGYTVLLYDVQAEALNIGFDRVHAILDGDLAKKRIDKAAHDKQSAGFKKVADWAALAACDLVIEAVFENMDVKKNVFRELDTVVRPDTLLASNTSYLDIDELAGGISHPERVLGLHFFSPAHIMKLVEIVRADKTSDSVLETALGLAKRTRKIGVVSGVCHGFIGNRMLSGYAREAGLLILEGTDPAQVDRALTQFGMPMGPFAMADMAGLDIGYANRHQLSTDKYEEHAFHVHNQLVEMGRKGQKTGAGFYRYEPGSRKPLHDPASDDILTAVRVREAIRPREISDSEITDRCVLALINEGAALLGEGIAQRGSDIDVVYANGYGFPRWRGGPLFYADSLGLDVVVSKIAALAEHHGTRWWSVAPLLSELAENNGRLSEFDNIDRR